MKCEICKKRAYVISNYTTKEGYLKRYYQCKECGSKFATLELKENQALALIELKRGLTRVLREFNERLGG